MQTVNKWSISLVFALVLAGLQLITTTTVQAQSSYFTSRGCVDCHSAPTVATCAGCHQHSGTLTATKNKTTSYAPGETVTITLTASGARSGWIGVRLYDQSGAEIARSTGNQSGMGGSAVYPAVLSAPAPDAAGAYTWRLAYFGNNNGTGTGDVHSEKSVNVALTVAAAVDTTAPVVGAFTLPATATSLTVPVASFTATDNVGVTGYQITSSAVAPTVWSATAPTSVTAASAGSVTFYAWARDAAGNVSLSRSATVVITLPDTTAPVVGAFTLPATSTSLTVPVNSFTATDNVGVSGYQITSNAVAPTVWSATAPTSVTAASAGSVTFYAWARDAAGNVSLSRSATVVITITAPVDITKPTLSISTLADGAMTNNPVLNVSGQATDDVALKLVSVNGSTVPVNANGSFSVALTLVEGENVVLVEAVDTADNRAAISRTITYQAVATTLAVTAPVDNLVTARAILAVKGTTSENSTVTVTVNGQNPQVASLLGNVYAASVYLVPGLNTVDINAVDPAGITNNAKRTVTYDNTRPTLAIIEPNQDMIVTNPALVLQGNVADSFSSVSVRITLDGKIYRPVVTDGAFTQLLTLTTAKQYTITVVATDAAGNRVYASRNVIYKDASSDDEHDDDDEHEDDEHDDD